MLTDLVMDVTIMYTLRCLFCVINFVYNHCMDVSKINFLCRQHILSAFMTLSRMRDQLCHVAALAFIQITLRSLLTVGVWFGPPSAGF